MFSVRYDLSMLVGICDVSMVLDSADEMSV